MGLRSADALRIAFVLALRRGNIESLRHLPTLGFQAGKLKSLALSTKSFLIRACSVAGSQDAVSNALKNRKDVSQLWCAFSSPNAIP